MLAAYIIKAPDKRPIKIFTNSKEKQLLSKKWALLWAKFCWLMFLLSGNIRKKRLKMSKAMISNFCFFFSYFFIKLSLIIANELAEQRREAAERQHYRAVRKYSTSVKNLEWSRDMFVRYDSWDSNDVVEKRSIVSQWTNRSAQRVWHQARVIQIVDAADSLLQLPFVLAFSEFWYLLFRRLNLDISQWANSVTASEQTAIKAILTIFTSELKTFDVVLNTWLQKKRRAQKKTIFLSSQLVFVLNGCSSSKFI